MLGTRNESEARYRELLMEFLPQSIRSEKEAEDVQHRIDRLINKAGSLGPEESKLLSLYGDLMMAWENGRYDLPDICGIEAVNALLEDRNLRQVDLVGPVFSTRSLASEILSGKRPLTLGYVEKLAKFFDLPAAVFYPS